MDISTNYEEPQPEELFTAAAKDKLYSILDYN